MYREEDANGLACHAKDFRTALFTVILVYYRQTLNPLQEAV